MATYAGRYGPEGFTYPSGQRAANAPYRVTTTLGADITLYQNKNKVLTKPNPNNADQYGNITFFANPGEYLLVINDGEPVPIIVNLHPDEPIEGGGGPGGVVSYEEAISIPVTVADITHNLGFDPAGITCIRTGGTRVYPKVTYTDPDTTVRLQFPSNFSGTVFLS